MGTHARRLRRQRKTYPNLATYIEKTGDTQTRIAILVGTSQATISRVVNGTYVPRPQLALRLSRYARVPLDSFVRVHLARHLNIDVEA